VEQLVALQHGLLVPAPLVGAEAGIDALRPLAALRRVGAVGRPALELRQDQLFDHRRRAAAPILPRQIAVPAAPAGIGVARGARLARQAEIADRDRAAALGAVAVGEGIKLLDIAQRMMRLPLDPAAQAGLERAVL